jgi:hypothetical protein
MGAQGTIGGVSSIRSVCFVQGYPFQQQSAAVAPFNDLAAVEENQHGAEHGKGHALRQIRQKTLCLLGFLAMPCISLVDFLKVIVDFADDPQFAQLLQQARTLQA